MAQINLVKLPAQAAAGAANAIPCGVVSTVEGTGNYLSRFVLHPTATIAADASNNVAIALVVYRAAASLFTYGTYTTTTALTANTPAVVAVTATEAQRSSLQPGDSFVITCTQAGTGVAIVVDKLTAQIEVV